MKDKNYYVIELEVYWEKQNMFDQLKKTKYVWSIKFSVLKFHTLLIYLFINNCGYIYLL